MAATPTAIAYAQWTQTWELVLTNGDVVEVPEALAKAPADTVAAGELAPFLVSGDGRHFFYFRKSDGLFVERSLNGKGRVVSRKLSTAGIDEEWPYVSHDGSYLVTTTSAPGMGIFADLRTGKVSPRPGKTDAWSFLGFSADGKRLLLAENLGKERLMVFDRGLRARMRLKPRVWPTALANDHVTAAAPVGKGDRYRKLRLLNLRTGSTSATLDPRLPRGQYIDDLDFDQNGRLIVRSKTRTGGGDLPDLEDDRQGDAPTHDHQTRGDPVGAPGGQLSRAVDRKEEPSVGLRTSGPPWSATRIPYEQHRAVRLR